LDSIRAIVDYKLYIGGAWRESGATFENRNPAEPSDLVGRFAAGTAHDVDEAFAAAREGAVAWQQTNPARRAEILFDAAELLRRQCDAIGEELTREEGKTLAEGRGEAARAAAILRFFAGECAQSSGEVYSSADDSTFLYSIREPLGIVGVITPWNFPIAIPAWKIAPALAFGNAVVWKPSELTPLCAVRLVEALHDAGLPAGVLNLVTGMPDEVGEALTGHRNLDALTFTGSGAVGRAIQAKIAHRGVKVQLEMGGKNPIIVLPDANLEQAVTATVRGAMLSTGQKCSATSRAIVHPSIASRFVERVIAQAAALRVGNPLDPATDVGPVVSEAQRRKVETYFEVAHQEGHDVALGGEPMSDPSGGHFVAPTVYVGVDPGSRIGREEIFGPVLAVTEADNAAEALRLANDTEYGLSASIFTHDLGAAMRFARDVQAGVVHINSETTGAEPHVPFGGMKQSSSHSREQGKAAREFFTDTKTVYVSTP
jgi:acyl-CoA reductase-like NAD-dependent aldehyde dehydrogenase